MIRYPNRNSPSIIGAYNLCCFQSLKFRQFWKICLEFEWSSDIG